MYDKNTLKENLKKCVANVKFSKTDGTERVLHCTLMEDYIPFRDETTPHVPRRDNDSVLAVWDIDNSGWRSFRLDSIIKIDYIGVENAASA